MDAFLDPGDEILVPNPVWLNYIHVPSALGAVPVTYSLKEENDYQIDFEEMESKITDKTKMIVVVNPSNPTGGVFSRETLEKLSEIALVPGSAFGSEGEGYLRISYACSYEDLREACAKIKKAVAELKNK